MSTKHSIEAMIEDVRQILTVDKPIQAGERVHPADAYYVYRLFLGRNPDRVAELPALLTLSSTFREFLTNVLEGTEFRFSSGIFPSNRMLMSEVEGFRFWFNSSDREMGVLMALGMYEPRTTALVKQFVRPGLQCLDLGAQTGFYTCLMASLVGPTGKISAFEPLPDSFTLLKRNLMENGFDDRVSAFPAAVSSHAVSIEGSVAGGMFIAGLTSEGDRMQMHTCRVDDVVTHHVDLIKMDIEGHEPAALEGMKGLLARCRPIILTEANDYWLRTCSNSSAGEYVDLLSSLGYDVYDVGDTSRPMSPPLHVKPLEVIDLLALPAGTTL